MAHLLPTAASQGFANATAYDAHRPSYPPEAVSSLLQHLGLVNFEGARVVEIASGTGKFTELLAARPEKYEIVAVEPLDSMRAQLVAKGLERVDVREGHASNLTGVKEGEADGVIAAQSFHWFANEEALTEVHRVLKSGSCFGMIWNIEDYNKPASWPATTKWEQRLNDWIHSVAQDGHPRFRDEKWQAVFESQIEPTPIHTIVHTLTGNMPKFSLPLGEESVKWTVWLNKEALWKRINTLSQVAVLQGKEAETARETFEEALKDVEQNEKGEFELHGVTFLAWTTRI